MICVCGRADARPVLAGMVRGEADGGLRREAVAGVVRGCCCVGAVRVGCGAWLGAEKSLARGHLARRERRGPSVGDAWRRAVAVRATNVSARRGLRRRCAGCRAGRFSPRSRWRRNRWLRRSCGGAVATCVAPTGSRRRYAGVLGRAGKSSVRGNENGGPRAAVVVRIAQFAISGTACRRGRPSCRACRASGPSCRRRRACSSSFPSAGTASSAC